MAFFKDIKLQSDQAQRRIEKAAWTCIYGGLLVLITGISAAHSHAALGWKLGIAGSLATAIGVILIYIRSRKGK